MTLARKIAALRAQLHAHTSSAPTFTAEQDAALLARLEAMAASIDPAQLYKPLAPEELTDELLVKMHQLHERLTTQRTA